MKRKAPFACARFRTRDTMSVGRPRKTIANRESPKAPFARGPMRGTTFRSRCREGCSHVLHLEKAGSVRRARLLPWSLSMLPGYGEKSPPRTLPGSRLQHPLRRGADPGAHNGCTRAVVGRILKGVLDPKALPFHGPGQAFAKRSSMPGAAL